MRSTLPGGRLEFLFVPCELAGSGITQSVVNFSHAVPRFSMAWCCCFGAVVGLHTMLRCSQTHRKLPPPPPPPPLCAIPGPRAALYGSLWPGRASPLRPFLVPHLSLTYPSPLPPPHLPPLGMYKNVTKSEQKGSRHLEYIQTTLSFSICGRGRGERREIFEFD